MSPPSYRTSPRRYLRLYPWKGANGPSDPSLMCTVGPSGYGTQCAIWSEKLQEMGHEVFISHVLGPERGAYPVGRDHGPAWRSGGTTRPRRCSSIRGTSSPDLVITLGDVWVLDPNVLRELPVAHWLPADCRPMSNGGPGRGGGGRGEPDRDVAGSGRSGSATPGSGTHCTCRTGSTSATWRIPEDKAALREAAGIGPDTFVIGVNAANNDAIRKAPSEMLLAFAKFLQSRPDSLLCLHTAVHCDGGQDLEFLAEIAGDHGQGAGRGPVPVQRGADPAGGPGGLVRDVSTCCSAATYAEGFGLPIVEVDGVRRPRLSRRNARRMEELNPDGLQVDGEPFYNGVHRGWWIRPSISGMVAALEQAYEQRGDVDQVKLRESVARYEVGQVAEKHMGPAVDELLERMAARRGVRSRLTVRSPCPFSRRCHVFILWHR